MNKKENATRALLTSASGIRHSGTRSGSIALTALALCLAGCAQLGPDLVKAGRNDYNIILQQTEDEEAILNLVRVRYGDRPLFLDVINVSTSFTWTQGASAQGTLFDQRGNDFQRNNLGVRGNLEYTERPTITYTPLGGKDFVRSLLTPADIDTLVLMSNSGWSIERLLLLMANSINGLLNAPSASGPTPVDPPQYEAFRQATGLMRQLQKKGVLRLGYQEIQGIKTPVVTIAHKARNWEQTHALKKLLGLDPEKDVYILDSKGNLPRDDTIDLELRSLIGTFYFVSHGVEVPVRDSEMGHAMMTRDENGKLFDWSRVVGDLVTIRSQSAQPDADTARVAIQYRGSWFYIDDSDSNTKYTLLLLEQLAALLGGKVEKSGPLLTLPVSAP
jgi:hypothetical protein